MKRGDNSGVAERLSGGTPSDAHFEWAANFSGTLCYYWGKEHVIEQPEPDEEAVRQGDPRAFDALYARYAPRVMGYLVRLGVGRTEAEDLTQETFLAAFRGSASFSGRSRPLAWLLGIAVRRWRDSTRRKPTPQDVAPAPPDAAATALRRLTLEEALAKLDEPLREALLLIGAQQLSYAEAAAVLEIPMGTLKWRVHEATKRMRGLLTETEDET